MIYGERIRLRAIERRDLPFFVAWLNDPEVRHGLQIYLPLSLEEEEDWFTKMLQKSPPERPLAIEVRDGESWKLIGNCGLFNIDWKNSSAELGIFIGDKSCWNRGFGSEAVRLLARHAFETLNLHRVYLRVYEFNARAIRAYEKAGFVLEGRMRQALYREGKYHDVLLMSILRSEWQSAR
ncbi:MAG: GNAT family protein [Anaerolineales bacterium]